MGEAEEFIDSLRSQIQSLEIQLLNLKQKLSQAESEATLKRANPIQSLTGSPAHSADQQTVSKQYDDWRWPLGASEYKRYGRQMILPEIGLKGQLQLKKASVLVIGIGGLGCPAAVYLAGAGVGTLGFVDGDTVEDSNLHRQILHTSHTVGRPKVESAIESLKRLNPQLTYRAHACHLEVATALDIIDQYDLVLDCTDHPTSRYLISDAAVVAGKPVVSASALRTEGQLLVLNYPPSTFPQRDTGFCYRCVYPRPPPAENVTGCGESGILGPVVGVMGVLMAVEAIRLITNPSSSSQPNITDRQTLLFYSAYSSPTFRTIRLRGKRPDCVSCSASTIINRRTFTNGNLNYATFCGLNSLPNLLPNQNRISAVDYHKLSQDANGLHTLVDVREKPQFDMCHLAHSLNIPYSTIAAHAEESLANSDNATPEQLLFNCLRASKGSIYFICRYGNDSQLAVQKLQNSTRFKQGDRVIQDIKGGLAAWRREVDSSFPDY